MGLRLFCVVTILLTASLARAQAFLPGNEFSDYVKSNESFGRKLLKQVHDSAPGQNVAVSPIGISTLFAPLHEESWEHEIRVELDKAFNWEPSQPLGIPSRMLLARFAKPPALPKAKMRLPRGLTELPYTPEEIGMTSELVYRPVKTIDNPFSEIFVRKAEAYFGLKFRPAGKGPTRGPTRLDAEGFKVSAPEPGERNGFWMTNAFHLRTAWVGNTFLLNDPKEEDFVLASGEHKKVLMMPSELGGYPHAKTDLYEAAILDAHNAYMLVILPAEGKNPGDIAKQLIEDPTMPTASLKRELGYVDLPSFEFQYDANVRAALEEMGVKRVFRDLGSLVKVPNSLITGASQRVEIQVDRSGIRANAGTVVAGVVGGIMGGNIVPFHMQINRPFIFLIRDNYTNALLFAGVVIDPTQH